MSYTLSQKYISIVVSADPIVVYYKVENNL